MTMNIGYGALGDNADFFMDGGSMVFTADEERTRSNMDEIINTIQEENADLIMLQEADRDSARSNHIDEYSLLSQSLPDTAHTYAYNFKVAFLPYPIPPLGKVNGGLATYSAFPISSAQRIQLPVPFPWPIRLVNLKRCLAVHRIPVEGSEHELVLVNLHLEAYDNGEGKEAQTKKLREFLQQEADAGNYVIAGGDFNQTFSNADVSAYPVYEGNWEPGILDADDFGEGWQVLMDTSLPTCRSLDQPYADADHSTFQYYAIDGFIVSENVKVQSVQTIQKDFVATDHNPVILEASLPE